MQYTINLIENNEINIAFLKANTNLLNNYKVNNEEELIRLWKQVYKVDLVLPDRMIFQNNTNLTLFLLQWS